MTLGARHRRCTAALVVVAGAIGAGCGGAIKLRQTEVESQAKRAVGHLIGRAPDAVTCPGDMPAAVGHSMRCTVDVQGSHSSVTITITSVDAERQNANFDVVLDEPSAASGRRPAPERGQAATSDGPGKWQAT